MTRDDFPAVWRRWALGRVIPAMLALLVAGPLVGSPDEAAASAVLCDVAARHASDRTGVPLSVLRALSLTETGRRRNDRSEPWPWTVNMEGKGLWFASRAAALTYVREEYARGARSFDIGCFQINYRWHHAGFATLDDMIEPRKNALYAARFLHDLYRETGDWSRAAGAYHSRTPDLARRYSARFETHLASLSGDTRSVAAADAPVSADALNTPATGKRPNSYPFLVAGGSPIGVGSLVPLEQTAARRLVEVR